MRAFVATETGGAAVLLAASVAALVWANVDTSSYLRFWETEFRGARAEKTSTNQRRYSRAQVERLLAIRELLYVRGYTIAGAKKALHAQALGPSPAVMREIRAELEELLRLVGE